MKATVSRFPPDIIKPLNDATDDLGALSIRKVSHIEIPDSIEVTNRYYSPIEFRRSRHGIEIKTRLTMISFMISMRTIRDAANTAMNIVLEHIRAYREAEIIQKSLECNFALENMDIKIQNTRFPITGHAVVSAGSILHEIRQGIIAVRIQGEDMVGRVIKVNHHTLNLIQAWHEPNSRTTSEFPVERIINYGGEVGRLYGIPLRIDETLEGNEFRIEHMPEFTMGEWQEFGTNRDLQSMALQNTREIMMRSMGNDMGRAIEMGIFNPEGMNPEIKAYNDGMANNDEEDFDIINDKVDVVITLGEMEENDEVQKKASNN